MNNISDIKKIILRHFLNKKKKYILQIIFSRFFGNKLFNYFIDIYYIIRNIALRTYGHLVKFFYKLLVLHLFLYYYIIGNVLTTRGPFFSKFLVGPGPCPPLFHPEANALELFFHIQWLIIIHYEHMQYMLCVSLCTAERLHTLFIFYFIILNVSIYFWWGLKNYSTEVEITQVFIK